MTFAVGSIGSAGHLATELLKKSAGVDYIVVPYKGTAPAFPDLIGGQIAGFIDPILGSLQYHKNGMLRVVAVTSDKRTPNLPDVATVAETVPGYAVNNWYGFFLPANTARPIVDRLSTEINRILKLPDIISLHNAGGVIPMGTTPEDFAKFIDAESQKWAKVIKEAGIRVE